MSASIVPTIGEIERVWVISIGEPLVLVEEAASGTWYLVIHHLLNGMWCSDKTFVMHNPSPGPDTIHGDLIEVGYPVGG